jgi:hypothetical protein
VSVSGAIDCSCYLCIQGGELGVIYESVQEPSFGLFPAVFISVLHLLAEHWTVANVCGGGSVESHADESEVREGTEGRASRRTSPECASCRYSMMMLVSTMLRSLSTSSGNLRSWQRSTPVPSHSSGGHRLQPANFGQ